MSQIETGSSLRIDVLPNGAVRVLSENGHDNRSEINNLVPQPQEALQPTQPSVDSFYESLTDSSVVSTWANENRARIGSGRHNRPASTIKF